MKSSKIIAVVIAVLALVWIASGFIPSKDTSEQNAANDIDSQAINQTSTEKPLMKVRVRDITPELFADTIVLTGRSQASRSVEIKAEVSGAVEKIEKEEGATVLKNDIIAELDVRSRAARKTEAQQRVSQRQIEYNAAKKLADKGFNSKVRLAQSLADLEDAKARLNEATLDLGKVKITAPFGGVIYQQNIDLGDYVDIGNTLFTIVDLDPIEFVGFISERRVQELKLDMPVKIELLTGREVTGALSYIAPAADPETRTFRLIITTDNKDNTLKEGLTAKLSIPVEKKQSHKISPSILSLNDGGKIGVKIVNDQNIVEFIPIQILSDKPGSMWVSGINDTARFITVGQEFVIEGQKVEPVQSENKDQGSLL